MDEIILIKQVLKAIRHLCMEAQRVVNMQENLFVNDERLAELVVLILSPQGEKFFRQLIQVDAALRGELRLLEDCRRSREFKEGLLGE